MYKNFL